MVENQKVQGLSVVIADTTQPEDQQVATVDSTGKFCLMVKPATYTVKVLNHFYATAIV